MEGLGIQQAVALNLGILRNILLAINQVRQFRNQCVELGDMVALLLVMMEADLAAEDTDDDSSIVRSDRSPVLETGETGPGNPSTPAQNASDRQEPTARTGPPAFRDAKSSACLKATLEEVHTFVEKCTGEWNFWQRSREIFVNRKIPRLKQRLFEWITVCIMETSAGTRNELRVRSATQLNKLKKIRRSLRELLTKTDESAKIQKENMRRLGHLQAEPGLHQGNRVDITFPEGDPRLQIHGRIKESQDRVGNLRDSGSVVCKEVKNDEIRSGRGLRHVEIYSLISTGTLVERFYGIAELEGKRFAVMEDLRNSLNLATAVEANALGSPLARLRLAYEVAHTVAYLHSVGIIVKNISDDNITLRRLEADGRFEPCLTNLEEARKIIESTAFTTHDVRFESPEYRQRTHHSKYSDIWSLGVVIWEFVTGTFPFSASPTSSDESRREIRNKLAHGTLPWDPDADKQGLDGVFAIVQGCWNLSPALRPPASYVAQTLLDFYTHWSIINNVPSPTEEVGEPFKNLIFEKIVAKRNHSTSTVTEVSVGDALTLKRSVDVHNDPRSAFLLGAAIWWELVPAETFSDSFSDGRLDINDLDLPPEVKRARVALSYLENSVDDAWREIGLAHAFLAKHFLGAVKILSV